MHFIQPKLYCLHLFLFACIFAFPVGAHAQEISSQGEPEQTDSAPRIESDPERNAFIFIIDGVEVARLDQSGFYIRDSIVYGGTLTDTGSEWIDDYIASDNPDNQKAGGNHDAE